MYHIQHSWHYEPSKGNDAIFASLRGIFVIAILLLCISLLQADHEAQRGLKIGSEWINVGPGLGRIQGLIPDRHHPGLWYAVNNRSLYVSRDAGRKWVATGLKNILVDEFNQSKSVTVHPITSEVLVLDNHRLWSSSDLGKTFTLRNASVIVGRIFSSPTDPNFLLGFSSSDYGLSISDNGGLKFSDIQNLPFKIGRSYPGYPSTCEVASYRFRDLMFSPFNTQTLFANAQIEIDCDRESATEDIFLVSYNAGKIWHVADNKIRKYEVDAAFPDFVIGVVYESLYRLTKRGWEFLAHDSFNDIIRIPSNENNLLAWRFSSIDRKVFFRSIDGGKSWTDYVLGLTDVENLELDFNRTWLAGTSATGVYIRSNSPDWAISNRGFNQAQILDVGRSSNGTLYILIGDFCNQSYLYSSTDNGKSWQRRWRGYPSFCSGDFNTIYINPLDNETLAIAVGSVYITHDSGRHWQRSKVAEPNIISMTFDPVIKDRIYAVGDSAYRSDDGGRTFQILSGKFELNRPASIHIDPNNNNILYFLMAGGGLYRSEDGGQTIEPRNNGLGRSCSDCSYFTTTDLAPLAQADSFLLTTSRGPIYKTIDGGAHWQKIAARSSQRIFPNDPFGRSFFVFTGTEVYFTEDGGKTWMNLTVDLDSNLIRTAVTDPRIQPFYVATDSGLFVKH